MYGWKMAYIGLLLLDRRGNKTWITKTLEISLQVKRFVV